MKAYRSLDILHAKIINFLFSLSTHKNIRENSQILSYSRSIVFIECGKLTYTIFLILKGKSCVRNLAITELFLEDSGLYSIPRMHFNANKLSPVPEIVFTRHARHVRLNHPCVWHL